MAAVQSIKSRQPNAETIGLCSSSTARIIPLQRRSLAGYRDKKISVRVTVVKTNYTTISKASAAVRIF